MNPADWWVKRSMDNETSFVKNPRRAQWVLTRDGIVAVVTLAALVGTDLFHDDPWRRVAFVTLALVIGGSLLPGVRRAIAYRDGWLDGRMAMVGALREATQRGMTPDEWLAGELARDYAVMGLHPPEVEEDGQDPA